MSKKATKSNSQLIRGGFIVATAIVTIMAFGISRAEQSSKADPAKSLSRSKEKQIRAKQNYIQGEVIVKLRDDQSSGMALLSQSKSALELRDKVILRRLEAEYGVNEERKIFKGVHKKTANTSQSSRISLASTTGDKADTGTSRSYLLKTNETVQGICARLKKDSEIEYAQPNYIYKRCSEPNDPEFADQYAHQLIQMVDAWDISTGSRDVVVAVTDTGVDVEHPDLKDNIWVNEGEIPNNDIDDDENGFVDDVYGWNFEEDNNDVIPEVDFWDDTAGHGTQVAGVIAATGNNGQGVTGINWQCSIMALRLSLYITSEEVASALDYATANGANVLNMSFGADEFGPDGDPIVKEAIDNAFAHGILLTASAGNEDIAKPLYPAAYYNVMAVASTNGEDMKTGHSRFGTWVDITAPGTDIVTTELEGEYTTTAGTSFSSPYVGAVGALVMAHRPELTHVEVRAILENTTDPVYYDDIDPIQGYIGTGRVNAYKALSAADERHPLGEIATPRQEQIFASDGNDIPIVLLVHGDSYRLEYTQYGNENWQLIDDNSLVPDANGFVHLSFANPGAGVFKLRLIVETEGATHTDRKTFGLEHASNLAPWPLPEDGYDGDEWYYGSPLCLDIDGDGRNEIIQPTITWSNDLWYYYTITIWKEDGTTLANWPRDPVSDDFMEIEASGLGVGDIDGDGDLEVIIADDYNVLVYAFHAETGELVEGNWPLLVGDWLAYIIGSPILADLDGDGDSEIIIALDEESQETDGLLAIQGDGTFLWQRRYTTEGPMSIADFDGDGNIEIAICGYGPGITRVYTYILNHEGIQIKKWRGGSKKGTAIADLDGDGEMELIFCTEDKVMAVHIDGSTVWETRVGEDLLGEYGALSVGDVDSDGLSEVYVVSYIIPDGEDGFAFSLVHGFDHEGKELSDTGFPKRIMGKAINSPPLIGDIDDDGEKELIVSAAGAPIMAWEADGTITTGFPMLGFSTDYGTSALLEDLDKDGDIELILNGDDYRFHVIDLPGAYNPETIDWGSARNGPQNSGWVYKGPKLNPIDAPDEINIGETLIVTISATNPMNAELKFSVGNLPEGAYYDPNTLTVTWEPATDQAFHSYTLSFLVSDGIRQDSLSHTVKVVNKR